MRGTVVNPAWFRDGRFHYGVGIEDTFIPHERPGHRKLDLYELTQHYENWRTDLALAADSGAELIRWGIPWYLTEQADGRFDFRWIDQVAAEMDRLGLRCVVDLMHYGTPLWLENTFLDPRYPELVARYAGEVASRYRGVFADYTPLNEPMVNAEWCGYRGSWPPYLTGDSGFVRLAMILVDGMRRTQAAITAADPDATIVHVDAGFQWAGDLGPSRPKAFLDEWRFVMTDLLTGRVGPDHPLRGYLLANGAREEQLDGFAADPVSPDVLGINYYPGFTRQGFDPQTGRMGTARPRTIPPMPRSSRWTNSDRARCAETVAVLISTSPPACGSSRTAASTGRTRGSSAPTRPQSRSRAGGPGSRPGRSA
jgi:hypothetical protein